MLNSLKIAALVLILATISIIALPSSAQDETQMKKERIRVTESGNVCLDKLCAKEIKTCEIGTLATISVKVIAGKVWIKHSAWENWRLYPYNDLIPKLTYQFVVLHSQDCPQQ